METLTESNAVLRQAQDDIAQGDSAQELKLKNYNNSLNCDAFLYIQQAPRRPIRDADLSKTFFAWHEGREIFFRLVDILRFEFYRMPSMATLPAMGMESAEWHLWWKTEHPEVEEKTLMAVYYYKKIKN